MEKLGGGGSQSAAGAQMADVPVSEAEPLIRGAIADYLASTDRPAEPKSQ